MKVKKPTHLLQWATDPPQKRKKKNRKGKIVNNLTFVHITCGQATARPEIPAPVIWSDATIKEEDNDEQPQN